jgi:Na+-translocating ferredoxin:NAD+ oxidoreductase subunit B
MVRKGFIRFNREDRKLIYGLMPFVVGLYGEQLPRMNQKIAEVFEQYFQETKGGISRERTSVHRVIPVAAAIDFEVEIFPHDRACELIESAKAWGVRDCICRVQQRLIGKECGHPIKNCLVFDPIESVLDNSEVDQAINKQEALDILSEVEQAGLVHTTGW